MRFNPLKTRLGRLKSKITKELSNDNPNIDKIIEAVEYYEKSNLDTIVKLKKNKLNTTKRISGALRQSIKAHGPIELKSIGSATKRIHGALLDHKIKTLSARRLTNTMAIIGFYLMIFYHIILALIFGDH